MRARLAAAAFAVLALVLPETARAGQPALALYEGRTIVTGTDMRMRPTGFAICLTDVLVKVSADPTLADDPRVEALGARAAEFVADFDYRDRQSHLPFRDQQGSYDRPYNLTVRFDPVRIDGALKALGRTPWTGARPTVVALVHVKGPRKSYDLTDGAPDGGPQREALQAAADRYSMTVKLADAAWPPNPGPDVMAVEGDLVWSDEAGGWVAEWRMPKSGGSAPWGARGVSFDEAFRALVRGAMAAARG